MTNLTELLGPDLQPPEDQHCCQCSGCVTEDDVASVARELLDKTASAHGAQSVSYSVGAAIDALDDQRAVFEDKPEAASAYARLEGLREDLDDWLFKFTAYVKDELKSSITTCDSSGHCEQHGGAPDPDRNRE